MSEPQLSDDALADHEDKRWEELRSLRNRIGRLLVAWDHWQGEGEGYGLGYKELWDAIEALRDEREVQQS